MHKQVEKNWLYAKGEIKNQPGRMDTESSKSRFKH